MDSEGQHRLEDRRVTVGRVSGEGVEPTGHRRLVVPADALPAKNARRSHHPDRPRGMSLHDGGLENAGHHDKIPFRSGGPVENDPLVVVVGAAQEPARKPIGKAARRRQRLVTELAASDDELGFGRPHGWIRGRLDNGSAAGDPALVDRRTESLIDLLRSYVPDSIGKIQPQPALFDLLQAAEVALVQAQPWDRNLPFGGESARPNSKDCRCGVDSWLAGWGLRRHRL